MQFKTVEEKITEAQLLFSGSYNCAQSTLSVFEKEFELDMVILQNITSGFGAGMCYQGRTCGAVAGAYMALGLISGKSSVEPEMIKENTYQLIQQFNKKFKQKHGSTICRELLEVDISNAQGIELAEQNGLFRTRCPLFVASAVELIYEQFKK